MSWPGTCKQRKPRSSEEDPSWWFQPIPKILVKLKIKRCLKPPPRDRYDGAVDGLDFRLSKTS